MPAETLRAWIRGLLWAFFIPSLNQNFHFRYPSVTTGWFVAHFPICEPGTIPGYRIFSVFLNLGPILPLIRFVSGRGECTLRWAIPCT
ncbi:hypothetical protein BGY98DRAFT_1045918 [Russula aff. rugulosa BPL654]|nr:hypothetical protein BGY98DRAFT_1045918 [Russula aff. rugulosa BPL654]